jgi:hypothetical protein
MQTAGTVQVNSEKRREKAATAQRRSLASAAYDTIKRRIVDGSLPQGYPILENDLAAQPRFILSGQGAWRAPSGGAILL